MNIEAKKITKNNFKKYGKLISISSDLKDPSSVVDFWPNLVEWEVEGGNLETDIGVAKNREHIVSEMERHLNTPELLISIDSDLIIPVAYEKDKKDVDRKPTAKNVECFLLGKGEGVLFNKGIWHYAPFPKREKGRFFVTFKRLTPENDFIMKELDEKIIF